MSLHVMSLHPLWTSIDSLVAAFALSFIVPRRQALLALMFGLCDGLGSALGVSMPLAGGLAAVLLLARGPALLGRHPLEAQPLAVGGVHTHDGKTRDLIFQATMGNWVYAFDAATGAKVWATNLGRPIVGTRAIDGHLTNVNWGILSTPVIDEAAGVLYACAWISDDGSVAKGQHFLAGLRISD